MTLYNRTLKNFNPDDQKKIKECMQRWEASGSIKGKVIPKNIQAEHFLPHAYMIDLLKVLLDNHASNIPDLEDEFIIKCRNMKRKGGRVKLSPLPQFLGRATSREAFVNWLFLHYQHDIFDTIDEVEDFIDNLKSNIPPEDSQNKMKMSEFTAWVTWDKGGSSNPFNFLQTDDPDEVISSLGLDLRLQDHSILLLEYERKAGILAIYRPSIADAELWTPYDPPIFETTEHGYTRPWPLDALKAYDPANPPSWRPQSQPEAVHQPYKIEFISLPLRELNK